MTNTQLHIKIFSIVFFVFFFTLKLKSQTLKDILFKNDSSLVIPTIEMPSVINDSLIHQYENHGKNSPYVFAQYFIQNIKTNKQGIWLKNKDNTLSWLCRIKSKTAYSLNFIIKDIVFPKGTSLYIFNIQRKLTFGPYTSKNVTEDSTLFVEPIPGEDVIFELDIPVASDNTKNYFTITKVGHDFRDFYKETVSNRSRSGSCEHDINCGMGLDWQIEKRSIVKYIYTENLQLSSCTGTLINNTTNNELPYILTANHCIKDAKMAASAIFYFNYENTVCGGSDASKNAYTISGSTLLATTKDTAYNTLDFSLLRLKVQPPKSISPYYSGWSIKTKLVNDVVTIHHPKGDATKISYSSGYIKNGSFNDAGYKPNTHWLIAKWDTGATEEGSSGSPLFNPNHQIIGDLSGGLSDCGNPDSDYYAKLYLSWDYFPDSSNQLKYWLDPLNSGVTECTGYDPLINSTNPITNVLIGDDLITAGFGKLAKGGWAGYSDPRLTQCADRFSGIKNKYIYAIKFPIQLFNKNVDVSKVHLKIWTGIDSPDSVIYDKPLRKDSIVSGKYYCMQLSNRINAGSDFFIGFDFSNLTNSDSLFLFTTQNRSNKSNSLYYDYRNEWMSATNFDIYSSLGIELYVTDNISPARATTKVPERLVNITFNNLDSVYSKELFHTDSICNYNQTDLLQVHYLKAGRGIWSGTNEDNMYEFAEKYSISDDKYLSGVRIAVARNSVSNPDTKIGISIMNGKDVPDSLLYYQEVNASELKPDYYNVIKFQKPFWIDSTFFVVLNTQNIHLPDSFALYMGKSTNTADHYHSFFRTSNDWMNYYLYDVHDDLGLSIETDYSLLVYDTNATDYRFKIKNYIKPSDIIFKSVFVFPNPASRAVKAVTLHFGNYFSSDFTITIYDIYGRIISTPPPVFNYGNTVTLSTENLSVGMYFIKVTVDNENIRPIPLIIVN